MLEPPSSSLLKTLSTLRLCSPRDLRRCRGYVRRLTHELPAFDSIWIDALVFGPFYAVAIGAFWKGKSWIRIPCFVWAGMMIAIVAIILFEELWGPTATAARGLVLSANLPWFLFPVAVIWRMRNDDPFARGRTPTS